MRPKGYWFAGILRGYSEKRVDPSFGTEGCYAQKIYHSLKIMEAL